jgi:hypothetical protein
VRQRSNADVLSRLTPDGAYTIFTKSLSHSRYAPILFGIVTAFGPGPGRRLGVLVDHLVPGSKELRIADAVRGGPGGADTLVVGHPYIDIWQAVKPQRLGLAAWPTVPRHLEWKHGACRALGMPHAN